MCLRRDFSSPFISLLSLLSHIKLSFVLIACLILCNSTSTSVCMCVCMRVCVCVGVGTNYVFVCELVCFNSQNRCPSWLFEAGLNLFTIM